MSDVLSVVAEWALAGHITEHGVTCEAGDAIRASVASKLGPQLRVPACPFAVFDEFGEGADDRVHDYASRLVAGAEHEHADATKRALFQAQEAAKELLQKMQRLEAAMQWIEDRARDGKLEIAPSVRGTGFEFGFWPGARAVVLVGAPTLLAAVEAAMDKPDTTPIWVSRVTECEACLTEDACPLSALAPERDHVCVLQNSC